MTKRSLIAFVLPAALLLAACSETSTTTVIPKSTFPIGADDTCGAAKEVTLIGQPAAAARNLARKAPYRVLEPNGVMTLEFSAERLNIRVNEAGRITELFCG